MGVTSATSCFVGLVAWASIVLYEKRVQCTKHRRRVATIVPKEKKSMPGVAGTARGRDGPGVASSVDTLAFPLAIEAGMNRFGFVDVDVSGSSFANWGAEWNERAGAFPPPRTRSGCEGFAGAVCFGAGSIDSKPDAPAPFLSVRAFFVGGWSASSSTSSPLLGFGRSIVIFFGRLACFGGGRETPDFEESSVS
jgi:hypothetical protein